MTQTAATNKEMYLGWAADHLLIDMDLRGTFASVPSEIENGSHKVRINEDGAPYAYDCSCNDRHYRKNYCKHMRIVDFFYARIAHIFAEETEQERAERNVEVAQIVEKMVAEQPISIEVQRAARGDNPYERIGDPRIEEVKEDEPTDPWAGLDDDAKWAAYGYYLMGIGA